MTLTPQAVATLLAACRIGLLHDDGDLVRTEGIVGAFSFSKARIAEHTSQIGVLLAELPDEFQAGKGGGWSFLNACNDRHGNLWTGEHRTMEALFCLGIAAGKAKWLMPREMWDAFPGGMPYVVVMP
jgi:hypothetical protein